MLLPIKAICDRKKIRKDGTCLVFIQYCYSAERKTLLNTEIAIPVNPGKVDPHSPFQIDPLKNDFKKGLKKAC